MIPLKPRNLPKISNEDEIVISGVAGRFPGSDNILHLQENLMNKVDLMASDDLRSTNLDTDIPSHFGKLKDNEKFDAMFFGIHPKMANAMDPQCRILLEKAYEAIVDAGINPKHISNSRTAVIIGCSQNNIHHTGKPSRYTMQGLSYSMFANRLSYAFNLKGPSFAVDAACSSASVALELAYKTIREGSCDAAIVGGVNICIDPNVTRCFFKLGVLSADGRCRSFDENADGYARSGAICAAYIQKAKSAKRIYATLVHAKCNSDGYKVEGISFPSSSMQTQLLEEFYAECGIPQTSINYVEAHATGTRAGDPQEVNAIDTVFTPGRSEPLLIGSVKSNIGHTEAASGLCSIFKVIISMESGIIPPNVNYKTSSMELKGIAEGRLKVVTEPTPWKGGYAAINSFGFGGSNTHILIKSHSKEKINRGEPNDDLPRLVVASGRTEDAVSSILSDLESKPVDVEYVKLLHDLHSESLADHPYRGYTLLPAREITNTPIRNIQLFSQLERPICFVFSGIGSQWPGMGETLLQLPVFLEAIKKCDTVLKPHGVDIFHVITNKEKTAFDNILNSFVGIAAIQIGLVDVLSSVGIEPDIIIGHSVGELGCAYADGCLTLEQMILAAYFRGKVSLETEIVHGSMAAVGLGYEKLKPLCPSDIDIACHNSSESATISGPAESMRIFVAELQAKGILAKEVPCSNKPFHSRYIQIVGPKLLAYLQEVIPNPRLRSKKWLSTSIPRESWNTPIAKSSSAEYYTNNILSSVLFEETSLLLPKDAVAIEIAPHGLLQAILRRSLGSNVINIALAQRNSNNLQVLLQSFGKMFMAGLHPKLANLYPSVEYPVSRGTQMISPVIRWDHSDNWFIPCFKKDFKHFPCEEVLTVGLDDDKYKFMEGHRIDGRNLFPATGYLLLIWKFFASANAKAFTELAVTFEDVRFLRATAFSKKASIRFSLVIHKGSGQFEINENGTSVVTGRICVCSNPEKEKMNFDLSTNDEETEVMLSRDVYKVLKLNGYEYTGLFQSIRSAAVNGSKGHIVWHEEWCSFMDNMMQMRIISEDLQSLFVPTAIKKLVIDPKYHLSLIGKDGEYAFPVYYNKIHDVLVSGGIEISNLQVSAISRRKPLTIPILEEYRFVPYIDDADYNLREIARIVTQICLENISGMKIKSVELIEDADLADGDKILSPWISESCNSIPLVQSDITILCPQNYFKEDMLPSNIKVMDSQSITNVTQAHIAIGYRLLNEDRSKSLNSLLTQLKQEGFIISRENTKDIQDVEDVAQSNLLSIISMKKSGSETYIILRKQQTMPKEIMILYVNNQKFDWVETSRMTLREELEKNEEDRKTILFVGQGDFENGLMGFINCLRKEPGGEMVRGILIQDEKAQNISLQNPFYVKEIQKNLAISVLRENGCWGTYRHLPLPPLGDKPVRHALVHQQVSGDLSSLTWTEGPLKFSDEKNIINVTYASLNFRDIMIASGKINVESYMKDASGKDIFVGCEFVGFDSSGKRQMGMIGFNALTNLCEPDLDFIYDIPDNWSFEEAATVPCVYDTCYLALYIKGKIKRGEKVLIHSGTGGVGQAAINLCLHEGCEIFTTVGTLEKRRFIHEHFPQIRDDHIGNSRDTSFEKMIKDLTNGKGVDIVLNSLADDKLQASVRCLAEGGRFLEIGKYDLMKDSSLGMQIFLRDISFQPVLLDALFIKSSPLKMILKKLIKSGIESGAVKPLVRTVFSKSHLKDAFRYMTTGKHIGKILIKIRENDEPLDAPILAKPRFYGTKKSSYLILGGLGGFGLELVNWLIKRGVRNIVIVSREGVKNGYQRRRLYLWQKSHGTQIIVITGKDVSKSEDCRYLIEEAMKLGPVEGIFNLAAVLNDALWENQTPESFEISFRCKAWATKHMDVLSRKMCPSLKYFVVFSSISSGLGNVGQTNYGMSNSVMERICEKRTSEGLPGLAIQWGVIGDVGIVAEMLKNNREITISGTLPQRISSCLHELDGFLLQTCPIVASMITAEKKATTSTEETVIDVVLEIMGMRDATRMNPNTLLSELGLDSMMGLEIKQVLEREFDIYLTAADIRSLTINKLQEMAGNQNSDIKSTNIKAIHQASAENVFLKLIKDEEVSREIFVRLTSTEETGRNEVYLIPGVDGIGTEFKKMAENLKLSAIILQFGIYHNNHTSITEMARQLVPYILDSVKDRQNIIIVGYSFGSIIAIELMRILESEGFNGKLIMIDGSPERLKAEKDLECVSDDDEYFETKMLSSFMHEYYNVNGTKITEALSNCSSWEDKVDTCAKFFPPYSSGNLSVKNQKALVTSLRNRLKLLDKYDISELQPIKAPIILFKPTLSNVQMDSEDDGISKVTNGKVKVYHVKGDHFTILHDEKVVRAISGYPIE